jgi:hypothetical protein
MCYNEYNKGENTMARTLTFKVEDDRGKPVEKTRSLEWVKDYIKSSHYRHTGDKMGAFTCEQTGDNEITCYNKKNQKMVWHFGGFDGYEVLEPWDDWEPITTKVDSITKCAIMNV